MNILHFLNQFLTHDYIDGAVSMILMSAKHAKQHSLTPLFRILGYADVCRDPVEFTIAPTDAVKAAINHANITTG